MGFTGSVFLDRKGLKEFGGTSRTVGDDHVGKAGGDCRPVLVRRRGGGDLDPGEDAGGVSARGSSRSAGRHHPSRRRRVARLSNSVRGRRAAGSPHHPHGADAGAGDPVRPVKPASVRPSARRFQPGVSRRLVADRGGRLLQAVARPQGCRKPGDRRGDRRLQQAGSRRLRQLGGDVRPGQSLRSQSSCRQDQPRHDPGGGPRRDAGARKPPPHRPQLFRPAAQSRLQRRRDPAGRNQRGFVVGLSHPRGEQLVRGLRRRGRDRLQQVRRQYLSRQCLLPLARRAGSASRRRQSGREQCLHRRGQTPHRRCAHHQSRPDGAKQLYARPSRRRFRCGLERHVRRAGVSNQPLSSRRRGGDREQYVRRRAQHPSRRRHG